MNNEHVHMFCKLIKNAPDVMMVYIGPQLCEYLALNVNHHQGLLNFHSLMVKSEAQSQNGCIAGYLVSSDNLVRVPPTFSEGDNC